jgi:hypothetical protein
MRTLLLAALLALSIPAFGDWIALTPEEEALNQRFSSVATREDAIAAFNSRHYLLNQRALEWLLIHRDTKTWVALSEQKKKFKGTAYYLHPILDHLAGQPPDETKPLVLIIRQADLNLLAKKSDPAPPRYEYDDLAPPAYDSLYQILARDLERFPSSNPLTASAARLLLEYRAPAGPWEESVKLKVAPAKAERGGTTKD